uniref:Uncharacterized protein n=1 Tax=Anopheles coluzzii TaxID=1518534 RepID=A0A8W7PCL0_ANOCL
MLPRVPDSTLSFPAAPALSTGINYWQDGCLLSAAPEQTRGPLALSRPGLRNANNTCHTRHPPPPPVAHISTCGCCSSMQHWPVICTTAAALPLTDGRPIAPGPPAFAASSRSGSVGQ